MAAKSGCGKLFQASDELSVDMSVTTSRCPALVTRDKSTLSPSWCDQMNVCRVDPTPVYENGCSSCTRSGRGLGGARNGATSKPLNKTHW